MSDSNVEFVEAGEMEKEIQEAAANRPYMARSWAVRLMLKTKLLKTEIQAIIALFIIAGLVILTSVFLLYTTLLSPYVNLKINSKKESATDVANRLPPVARRAYLEQQKK